MKFERSSMALLCIVALSYPCLAEDSSTAAGARIYANNCSNCHGDDLENNSHIAFDLRRLRGDEHARFVNSVLHGKNALPSWEGVLDAAQIEALWTYIRANAYQ
jgi:mono/diheme cytochrome c family protein